MAKPQWVNFTEVKKAVSIEQELERRGLLSAFHRVGDNLVGACPIHDGENPRVFKVSPDKGAWYCFGSCRRGGNVLDLVATLEGCSTREAALFLVEAFDLESTPATHRPKKLARAG